MARRITDPVPMPSCDQQDKIASTLGGKTVVSADHGELLGERKLGKRHYAHHEGMLTEELRRVPYQILEFDSRRQVTVGETKGKEPVTESEVQKQLELLGYK